ncbi:MAG: hypothetical protein DRZ82_06655 [Thermoprotei archaeon]|nr:MAG: hypothetical protein DRZ82_06655 [Thermoprotei archaeon]
MNVEIIPIKAKGRWHVVFREDEKWQCGIYVPENESLEDIKFLELHNAPELFILIKGKINLVLMDESGKVHEIPMEEGKLYIVQTWHNAYRPNGKEGIALVIERPDISTEYRNVNLSR